MKTSLITALIPFSIGFTFFSNTSQAQANSFRTIFSEPLLVSQVFKPSKRGAPKTTAGGATRGSCTQDQTLTPLIPHDRLSLTLSERPTFFWSAPQTSTGAAQFLLMSDNDTQIVYETILTLPSASGIVEFTLPAQAPALEVGKQYHWYLTIACSPDDFDNGMRVEGWVERANPDRTLTQALKMAEPDQHSRLYAEAGIWHEALSAVAKTRRDKPADLNAMDNWKRLLESVGLNTVVAQPLVAPPLTEQAVKEVSSIR
ncbi:MAG: DUF928 domain-containing protein [Leptolyngbyaceae cyanobacterium SU_3_3]|nr:DUF928 domain-containing protein [Leptolyngbyaceae cyanobacterium SU_3_3]